MRWFALVVAVMMMVAAPSGASAALQRTSPPFGAGHSATARWWQRLVRITYPNGRWEYAFQIWYGLADNPTGNAYRTGGMFSTPISGWSLVGATIIVLGEPSSYIP